MPTLTWKDNRLPANDVAPWDTTLMFVGPTTPLGEMVSDSERWCREHESSMNLMIYCHGSPGSLLICDEKITLGNMHKLVNLAPYFDFVSIHACLIAKGQTGRAFCSRLAALLLAPVAGAVKLQSNSGMFTLYGQLDDRKYDGDYYIHNPSGAVLGPLRSPNTPEDDAMAWLRGWWTVWDGTTYYYHFAPNTMTAGVSGEYGEDSNGFVSYTKTRPAATAPPPPHPLNTGDYYHWNNGHMEVNWEGGTQETYENALPNAQTMNATSNRYSPLVATRM